MTSRTGLPILGLSLALLITIGSLASAQEAGLTAELNALLSRLQSMGQGSYTQAEWQDVYRQLDDIAARAERENRVNDVIEARIIKAMVLGDMRGDYKQALAVLQDIKKKYGKESLPAMKKVYVREAEMYSKMGDEASVRRVMEEFKASKHFDPESYPYSGGQGPEVPLLVTRPAAKGSDSISVTAMEVARKRARVAPGNFFPEFHAVDINGRAVALADYRGKVVLIDFWGANWTPWRRDLPNLVSAYKRYSPHGFDILGICLDRDTSGLQSFVNANGMSWRQIAEDDGLARQLSIFGEATNFLVDQNGVIIGRDLRGADLVAAIKAALAR